MADVIGSYFKIEKCIRKCKCKRCGKELFPTHQAYMVDICSYCESCFLIISMKMLGTKYFTDEAVKRVTTELI